MPKKRPATTRSDRGTVLPKPLDAKPAIVGPAELTSDERAALAEKIEAARQRGHPPSI
jgi:hypothetical protein